MSGTEKYRIKIYLLGGIGPIAEYKDDFFAAKLRALEIVEEGWAHFAENGGAVYPPHAILGARVEVNPLWIEA